MIEMNTDKEKADTYTCPRPSQAVAMSWHEAASSRSKLVATTKHAGRLYNQAGVLHASLAGDTLPLAGTGLPQRRRLLQDGLSWVASLSNALGLTDCARRNRLGTEAE